MHFERDIKQIKSGEKTELIYTTVTGIKPDLSGPQQVPEILDNSIVADSSGEESTDGSDADVDKKQFVSSGRPRDESPNSRKVTYFFFYLFLILKYGGIISMILFIFRKEKKQ